MGEADIDFRVVPQFTYYEPAAVVVILPSPGVGDCNGICPRSGPTSGGTVVVVSGKNFLETNETTCKFQPVGTGGVPSESGVPTIHTPPWKIDVACIRCVLQERVCGCKQRWGENRGPSDLQPAD